MSGRESLPTLSIPNAMLGLQILVAHSAGTAISVRHADRQGLTPILHYNVTTVHNRLQTLSHSLVAMSGKESLPTLSIPNAMLGLQILVAHSAGTAISVRRPDGQCLPILHYNVTTLHTRLAGSPAVWLPCRGGRACLPCRSPQLCRPGPRAPGRVNQAGQV